MNITDFNEDISPLLQALWRNKLIPGDAFLGLVEFGTEAFHSDKNITFTVSHFGMNLTSGTAPNLATTTATTCPQSTAPTLQDSLPFFWVLISGMVVTVVHIL